MSRIGLAVAALAVLLCASADAQLVAEKVTTGNASKRLFSGPDATGGSSGDGRAWRPPLRRVPGRGGAFIPV